MAQSALTVTPPNPTPPTNLIFLGTTPPVAPAQVAVDDGIAKALPNSTTAGTNSSTLNEDSTVTTWPTAVAFATSTVSADPTNFPSATHEGRGTELAVTATSVTPLPAPLGQLKTVSCGPVMDTPAKWAAGPNALHASSLSGTAVPTLSGATGANNVSGIGTTTLTATGTNYNRASVISVAGVPQNTSYVSATSLTAGSVVKRTTAGTVPVTVTSNGITTAPQNWTLT